MVFWGITTGHLAERRDCLHVNDCLWGDVKWKVLCDVPAVMVVSCMLIRVWCYNHGSVKSIFSEYQSTDRLLWCVSWLCHSQTITLEALPKKKRSMTRTPVPEGYCRNPTHPRMMASQQTPEGTPSSAPSWILLLRGSLWMRICYLSHAGALWTLSTNLKVP